MSIEARLNFLSTCFNQDQADQAEGLQRLLEEQKAGTLIQCLDDGFVRLVDHMGDDSSIVRAARVSYGKGTKSVSDDRNLIRYMMSHKHTSPFESVEWQFHIRVPMDCWRQWIRHRTASVSEYSTRYSEAIDSMQGTLYDEWRLQSTTNKQGSSDGEVDWPSGYKVEPPNDGSGGMVVLNEDNRPMMVTDFDTYTPGEYLSGRELDFQIRAEELYQERLKFGIAREQARKDLPLSTYTEAYWKIDLHNLLHFLELRMSKHAQLEIRTYANAIAKLIKPIIPVTWEAFEDYRLHGMMLSYAEQQQIRCALHPEWTIQFKIMSDREKNELSEKMDWLGISTPSLAFASNEKLAS